MNPNPVTTALHRNTNLTLIPSNIICPQNGSGIPEVRTNNASTIYTNGYHSNDHVNNFVTGRRVREKEVAKRGGRGGGHCLSQYVSRGVHRGSCTEKPAT